MNTIYENDDVIIRTNGSNEWFVKNKRSDGVEIRISNDYHAIGNMIVTISSQGGRWRPTSYNGLSAMIVE